MDIVKKFKDFFKKEEDRPRYMNIPTGNKHRQLSFDLSALENMEDKVSDIFFGSIDGCDDFEINYQTTIEGAMMRLDFRYNYLFRFDLPKSDTKGNWKEMNYPHRQLKPEEVLTNDKANAKIAAIESGIKKDMKKLILEYNTKDNRVVNVDNMGFNHSDINHSVYTLYIWRYKQKGEK